MSESSKEEQTSTCQDGTLDFWIQRWQQNKIGFHRTVVSYLFEKHMIPKLTAAQEQLCVLFTLCGKTLDMIAVLEAGHRVIGIEGCQSGVEAFFQENNIKYEIEKDETNKCQTYKGTECPLTIYVTDFFTFNKPLPPIDYIWDRGGLVAINPSTREQYRDRLIRIMAPERTQLFVVAINYTDLTYTGPPFVVNDDNVQTLFGSTCSCELVEAHDETEEYNSRVVSRIDFMEERLHLIVQKQT
ncbi:unnamed protein product [Rotaria socialis]|uniref:thiopurine S-methyltransferase n=2 Tax=Rotaria socialis TaxID=392032 RepID=A0A821CUF2_9BILA|nr:unnamed protein product [Rotaria socialis]CAF3366908.1 unnamed protein product [Rotaria socialis]CAF3465371.1 unnamed protein product [Rotaria socialis]CAF4323057.1 unnamed protein product [Rotaria socialis]CAF4611541.1 unnamed protein product [Rotaria socialis]